MKLNRTSEGILLGIISAVFYGLNPLFALPLYEEGMNPDSVLFYRYGFAVVLLAVLLKLQRQSFSLSRKEIVPIAVMGLLFSASSLFLYLSFMYMDAGLACTILFVYPILESSYNKENYDEAVQRMGGTDSWYNHVWWDSEN